jgi:hypothetical protein
MKLSMLGKSLATRALLLGLINAAAVLALGLVTMESAYHSGLVDFFRAPVQERILSISRSISLDLLENDSESWNEILKREAQGTPFQFALLDNYGRQIAGEPMEFPAIVHDFSSNVTSKLTYIPKFESNERPERKYSAGNFLLQRDPNSKMYWAGVHVLMRYKEGRRDVWTWDSGLAVPVPLDKPVLLRFLALCGTDRRSAIDHDALLVAGGEGAVAPCFTVDDRNA